MARKFQRICVIPARGGSKRIKNKNKKLFCGKPMIQYAIMAAQGSNLFDSIIISSDDPEILKIGKASGCLANDLRPEKLAGDYTPVFDVIKYEVEKVRNDYDNLTEVWFISASSPMVSASILIKVAELSMDYQSSDSIIAVEEFPVPVQWALKIGKNKVLEPFDLDATQERSQDLKSVYYDAGLLAVYPTDQVMKSSSKNIATKFKPYILPKYSTVDIDTEEDWAFAEKLFLMTNNDEFSRS